MKKSLYLAGIVLLGAVAFMACDTENTDNEKPVITVMEPAEDEAVMPGSAVHFVVQFADNVALASYKVDIHSAFDGHTHNAAVNGAIGTRAATDSVAFEKTWLESDFIALGETPIAGKKQAYVAHQHIVIPSTVNGKPLKEGHYHFIVYCTDSSGQESFIAREIVIAYDAVEHEHSFTFN